MPAPHPSRIRDAATFAEAEFWRTVAVAFPQVKTGDLSPLSSMLFTQACRDIVQLWVETNWQDATFTERQEAHRRNHPDAEEPF